MQSSRLQHLVVPTLAGLVLIGCGPRGPSIPAIPRATSGDPSVSVHPDQAAVRNKGKKPVSRQKMLPQLSPMPWAKK
jgi:hypothetical protein